MDVVIIGAGGHGRVVLDILRAEGKHNVVGFLDADPTLAGSTVGGLPVMGRVNNFPRLREQRVKGAIVAIGESRARRRYAQVILDNGLELISTRHPSATLSASASIGRNVVIAPGAIIGPEARVEDSAIINTASIIEHECVIGTGAHICPAAAMAGRVNVSPGAFIGLGSRIIQCLTIGEDAIVGAGAVVIADVPASATVVGVPARVVKIVQAAEMTEFASM
jgi:sugar O-acyltransferase (sialic acid O-acetyltransferase NeuD family)